MKSKLIKLGLAFFLFIGLVGIFAKKENIIVNQVQSVDNSPIVIKHKDKNWTLNIQDLKDQTKIDTLVNTISKQLYKGYKEPSLQNTENGFKITSEVYGSRVNSYMLKNLILSKLESQNNILDKEINVPLEVIKPKYTKEQLSKIKDVIGEYKTSLSGSENRKFNLNLASSKIKRILVFPNNVFSLNTALGPRTAANGFKLAPVIFGNKISQDEGGGVCQLATTLYGAVLRAKLGVVERTKHTIPPKYCPLGQDATIAENYIDFKFRNNYNFPIYIVGSTDSKYVYVKIYGIKQNPNEVVAINSEIINTFSQPPTKYIMDNTLNKGVEKVDTQGNDGYEVKVYRITKVSGVQKIKEFLTTDKYEPIATIIKVGTK